MRRVIKFECVCSVLQVYAHEKGGHVIQDEHPSSVSKQTIRNNGDLFYIHKSNHRQLLQ